MVKCKRFQKRRLYRKDVVGFERSSGRRISTVFENRNRRHSPRLSSSLRPISTHCTCLPYYLDCILVRFLYRSPSLRWVFSRTADDASVSTLKTTHVSICSFIANSTAIDNLTSLKRSSYYDSEYRPTAALIRARRPYIFKNMATGVAIMAFAAGVCGFICSVQIALTYRCSCVHFARSRTRQFRRRYRAGCTTATTQDAKCPSKWNTMMELWVESC